MMPVTFILKISFLLAYSFSGLFHPVHVSVTSIEYVEDQNHFSVSFKIFTDDFETILFNKYGVELKIDEDPKPEDQIPYFNRYISDSFRFMVNDEGKMDPRFERKRKNEDSVWLFYSFTGHQQKIETATIRNAIMMDMFDDQMNLLIFKYLDFERGYQFSKDKVDLIIELNP